MSTLVENAVKKSSEQKEKVLKLLKAKAQEFWVEERDILLKELNNVVSNLS